jgi:protein-S-isoprenylcysteine O-methyltransferase Ste14
MGNNYVKLISFIHGYRVVDVVVLLLLLLILFITLLYVLCRREERERNISLTRVVY